MASITLQVGAEYSSGTTVSAYRAVNSIPVAPVGSVVTTAIVGSDGNVTFSGLTENVNYLAYASSGSPQYVRFYVPAAAAGTATTTGTILPWVTATAYVAGQPVTNGGKTWLAVDDHTSGASFSGDSAHWSLLPVAAGTTLTERGAWAPATTYAVGDSFTRGGARFVVTTAYTSGGSFGTTDLTNTFATGAAVDDSVTAAAGKVPIFNGTTSLFTPGTVTPVPGPTEAVPLYTFGHSYAVGSGSSTGFSFVTRLAGRLRSGTNINSAVGGTMPQHAWGQVRTSWTVGTKGLALIDCLINQIYGTGESAKTAVHHAAVPMYVRSMLRLLRTAARKRYDDASITLSNPGNTVYQAGNEWSAIAMNAGQTATIASYTDTEIVIVAYGSSTYVSNFDVSVAGTSYGTASSGSGDGFDLETMRVTGLPAGSKTIVITALSSPNQPYFNGYMRAASATPPSVVLVKDCPILAWSHGGWATKAAADAELAILNGYLDTIAGEAEFGGPTQTVVADPNPGWDPALYLSTDLLHPNNIGHGIYADTIQSALATLTYRDGLLP